MLGHGSWYYALDVPNADMRRRARIRRGGYLTRVEASEALERLRMPSGSVPGEVVKVGQWLTHWREARIRSRENTRRSYRGLIEHYLIPHLGRIPLVEPTFRDVKRVLVALILGGGRRASVLAWRCGRCRRPLRFFGAIQGHRLYAALHLIALRGLRHGAASLALQADADLKSISDQLGHSSIVLTVDTYISVLPHRGPTERNPHEHHQVSMRVS